MPEITLLLHNIRSTYNVGAIFRTAEGFGVKRLVLTGYTPYPTLPGDKRLPHISEKLTRQINKTALGAEKIVPFSYFESIDSFLNENSLPLIALEQSDDSMNLRSFRPPHALTLVVGEEVHGIDTEIVKQCDTILEIPMKGVKESFNVSVATGIALYELIR